MDEFLPISQVDMDRRGISQLDFICITGDSYVDHPSFGISIISRVIENIGFTVGIISQPMSDEDYMQLGTPKYAFMITSGNIDSMVAHYTASKKLRSDDAYTAGGKAGKRPDRAVIVYSKRIRQLFGDIAIAIGGLEASLRRFAHYDYWDDAVRPSILLESSADLLMFGMGERSVSEIARRLGNGENIREITNIRGTCYITEPKNVPMGGVDCPSYEQVRDNKESYARACKLQYDQQDEVYGKIILQRHGQSMMVQNPPALSLNQDELDKVYALPYVRTYHPIYEKMGGVDGIKEVEFSITHNRGCFGNCNFCSIALHQGRKISSRSEESILKEALYLTTLPNFKGYIHDVGGPTANFRQPSCTGQLKNGLCKGKKCLAPTVCKSLEVDHSEYLGILRKIREIPGIKRVFIRSGIRFDYLIQDKNEDFFRELVENHTSGQLKVAPEHCSAVVLDKMGKPHIEAYKRFSEKFYRITKSAKMEQYLVPYLMSSHPGSGLREAIELAIFLKEQNIRPEQVQDFYPTPGTVSTCMFYTGLDPYTMQPVFVPKTTKEKAQQRALLQYYKRENKHIVMEALKEAGRIDLIGNDKKCLVSAYEKRSTNGRGLVGGDKKNSEEHGRNANRKNPNKRGAGVLNSSTSIASIDRKSPNKHNASDGSSVGRKGKNSTSNGGEKKVWVNQSRGQGRNPKK